ncbi:chemotaxis protein CheX [Thiovibrio frasassiensis]|uniref:Chemotaxis protein CheX n=1 Tax=Thiovibrio frasassiensis TaxID=2984131 RepID=A0A9X4MC05_9BACT|nr:chemotaxis protein CheX [Thiovibrio frasassiensis]MDG4474809.1 chemotaxis protein CheX [Thiovibrio frasassiensis]
MDQDLRRIIFKTFSEVFETMFFTFLEPLEEVPGKEDLGHGRFIEATISYSGGCNGSFLFYFPWELGKNITVNFLGVDEDGVQEGQVKDTAAETANMAIGSLLGELDPGGKAALAIPQARVLAEFSPEILLGETGLYMFNTEFGVLWVVGTHA